MSQRTEQQMRDLGLDPDEPNPWPGHALRAGGFVFVPIFALGQNGHSGYAIGYHEGVEEERYDRRIDVHASTEPWNKVN